MDTTSISKNALAFIGLATEYCAAVEQCPQMEREEFVAAMLRLLPRLYISISDVRADEAVDIEEMPALGGYLEEQHYEDMRAAVAALLGEDDTYLETHHEDMKYSDTPIGASISEGLADIYQVLYDFLMPVRDSEGTLASQALQQCREAFGDYWSQTLCNVMRPLNQLGMRN